MLHFSWQILQAVCLGFAHIPWIGQITFQILKQTQFQSLRLTQRLSHARPYCQGFGGNTNTKELHLEKSFKLLDKYKIVYVYDWCLTNPYYEQAAV